jgi:putative flippase GtrA
MRKHRFLMEFLLFFSDSPGAKGGAGFSLWSSAVARPRKHRFIKFAIVGCLGAALQLSLLAILTKHMATIPATLISVELAILHNFLWHERYTWPNRITQHLSTRLIRFHLANGLVSLCGNTFITYLLVTHLHLPTLPSALAAIAFCSLANFTLTDKWVYA